MISNESRITALRGALSFLVKKIRESDVACLSLRNILAGYMINVLDADDSCARMIAAENENNIQLKIRDSGLIDLKVKEAIAVESAAIEKMIEMAIQQYGVTVLELELCRQTNAECLIWFVRLREDTIKETVAPFNNENLIKGSDDL